MNNINKCENYSICKLNGKLKCSGCKSIFYCSVQCQKSNWKKHKDICKCKQKEINDLNKIITETTPIQIDNDFEFRAINLLLLKKIAEYAKLLDPNNPWSIARISNVLIGSHESESSGNYEDGTPKNRWLLDSIFNINNCITNNERNSLINILRDKHSIIPHPLLNVTYDQVVGEKANVFVSFAYISDFFELIDSIEQYFINNPSLNKDKTYFWLDMIVNNQWKADVKGFDWWTSTFKNAIAKIGKLLLFISKWDEGPLLRAWCVFELYCAAINKCKFEVIMSNSDRIKYLDNIIYNPTEELRKLLYIIKSKNSTCWVEEDRIKIHKIIMEIIGFDRIDTMIFEQLREWIIQSTLSQYNNENNEIKKLDIMDCLANLNEDLGNINNAELLYIECFNKRKMILGADHVQTLRSMFGLASLYNNQGKLNQAEPLFLECLHKQKIVFGRDNIETFQTMNSLAALYDNQEKYTKAEELYLECLNKLNKRVNGVDNHSYHKLLLDTLNNLAILYHSQGKLDQAELYYLKSINTNTVIYGNDKTENVDVMSSLFVMSNLAALYGNQGKLDKSEKLLIECLNKRKIFFGDDHPDTVKAMHNLAYLYKLQGKFNKARPIFVECLRKQKIILGDNHPETKTCMNNLAALTRSSTNTTQNLQSKSITIEPELLINDTDDSDDEDLNLAKALSLSLSLSDNKIMTNLADVNKSQGKLESLKSDQSTVAIAQEDHPDKLNSMHFSANLLRFQGKYNKAEELYLKCLSKRKNILGDDHPDTLLTMGELGTLYSVQEKFDLAEPFLEISFEKNKIVLGASHPQTLHSMSILGALYTNQGKHDKAEKFYIEFDKLW